MHLTLQSSRHSTVPRLAPVCPTRLCVSSSVVLPCHVSRGIIHSFSHSFIRHDSLRTARHVQAQRERRESRHSTCAAVSVKTSAWCAQLPFCPSILVTGWWFGLFALFFCVRGVLRLLLWRFPFYLFDCLFLCISVFEPTVLAGRQLELDTIFLRLFRVVFLLFFLVFTVLRTAVNSDFVYSIDGMLCNLFGRVRDRIFPLSIGLSLSVVLVDTCQLHPQ